VWGERGWWAFHASVDIAGLRAVTKGRYKGMCVRYMY
jgi:hypothetical protein